jgi:hypothetical protein
MEALLEQERQLLKLYQQEIQCFEKKKIVMLAGMDGTNYQPPLLNQKESSQALPSPNDSVGQDPLQSMIMILPPVSNEIKFPGLPNKHSHQYHETESETNVDPTVLLKLQSVLRGFSFTEIHSVGKNSPTSNDTTTTTSPPHTSTIVSYNLHGCFVMQPTLHATFVLELDIGSIPGKVRNVSCRVVCQERNPHNANDTTHDSWNWLAVQAKPPHDTCDFPGWLNRLTAYLDFDHQRQAYLHSVAVTFPWQGVAWKQRKDTCRLVIPLNQSTWTRLVLVWAWDWENDKDTLSVTTESIRLGVSQMELDCLVQTTGSCHKAVDTIISRLTSTDSPSHQRSSKRHHEIVFSESDTSLHESDRSDESAVAEPSSPGDADDEGTSSSEDGPSTHQNDDDSIDDDDEERNLHISPNSGRRRSEYEVLRLQKMKRNADKLAELGLSSEAKPFPGKPLHGKRKRKRKTIILPSLRK